MRILGAVIIAAGLLLFAQFQYLPALICIVIGAVFMGKPRAPKPEEADEEADGKTDSELVRVDAPLTTTTAPPARMPSASSAKGKT